MNRKKIVFSMYIIIVLLSVVSLISYNNRSIDFFSAISSLSNDFTIIGSFVVLVYILIVAIIYMKDKYLKKEDFYKNIIFSLLFLFCTLLLLFTLFITVFSHKNIFSFLKEVLKDGTNIDILKLFVKSIIMYYFIFLSVLSILIINNKLTKKHNLFLLPIFIFLFIIILFLLIYYTSISLKILFAILDILLFILVRLVYEKN